LKGTEIENRKERKSMSYANAKTLALKLKQFKQLLNAPVKKRYNLVANVVV